MCVEYVNNCIYVGDLTVIGRTQVTVIKNSPV